jgi:FKBP-type peptidyl-prolyl cis-trans isomerase
MKRIFAIALCICLALAAYAEDKKPAAGAAPAAATAAPAAQPDSSYSIGMLLGANLKSNGLIVDLDAFMAGFKDTQTGAKPKYTDEEAQAAVQAALSVAKEKKLAAVLAEGKAFLENNKKKAGVKVTASGLQYEVIKAGTGKKPVATDTVKVDYEGKSIAGAVFDSSYQRGEPVTFPLNQVIPGWTEGVQLMNVGSKYRFVVPSELAYGDQGAGDVIEPNAVLVFEVELLSIEAPEAAAPAEAPAAPADPAKK